jgi:hypothetical protein
VLVLCIWALITVTVWTGPALAALRYRAHNNLAAASFVARGAAPCGVGLYGLGGNDWIAFGGYTYLHRPAPMYWPEDEAALSAFAPGFDTLVYSKPPPDALGFTPQRCFGEICVARRQGGCVTLPMVAMPFPDPAIRPHDVRR